MDDATGFARTYATQAATYDRTRSAGRETVGPLLEALGAAPGNVVLDVGGGTGNYALAMTDAGYDVTILDRSPDMRAVAEAKGLRTREADATALPVGDGSADAVTLISMLHQVPDWKAALAEAQRVLRPGGVLCLLLYTSEHLRDHWLLDYYPSARTWLDRDHIPIAAYLDALPGAAALPLQIKETDDLTVQAMRRHPRLALDESLRAQTSFFARLAAEYPAELVAGTARLAHDIEHDALPAGYDRDLPDGDAYLVVWHKPA